MTNGDLDAVPVEWRRLGLLDRTTNPTTKIVTNMGFASVEGQVSRQG